MNFGMEYQIGVDHQEGYSFVRGFLPQSGLSVLIESEPKPYSHVLVRFTRTLSASLQNLSMARLQPATSYCFER
jgi:hypothetical protein